MDFGARIYDPRLGRWLSVDPFAKRYPQLTPFNFAGNSPILFIDPNGKEIIIHYLNEQGKADSYTFKPGIKPTTSNFFVQKAYDAITFSMKYDSDVYKSLIKSPNKVNLYYRSMDGSHGSTDETSYSIADKNGSVGYSANADGTLAKQYDATIYWDPSAAVTSEKGGGLSPATLLFHEANHAKRKIFLKTLAEFYLDVNDNKSSDSENQKKYGKDYDTPEEKRVIDIENEYVKKVNEAELKNAKECNCVPQQEAIRKEHHGEMYRTNNVFSIKPVDENRKIEGTKKTN